MYTGRRRKSPTDRRLGGRGKKGGTLGRQASFDFIVIKSEKKKSRVKSRENNKQTENKRREKGREKGGLKTSRRKKESEKKNEPEICRMALRTSETIRPRFVCPIEFKA